MERDYGYEWMKARMEYDLIPGMQMMVDGDLNVGMLSA